MGEIYLSHRLIHSSGKEEDIELIRYQCEVCGVLYETREKALDCEAKHVMVALSNVKMEEKNGN